MISIKRIQCGNGNCYIVTNGKESILIDTSKREYIETVIEACKPYDIKLLVLTHAHFDHADNAKFISEKFGIPIAVHKGDCSLIDNNMNQSYIAKTFLGKIVLKASLKDFTDRKIPKFQPSVYLTEGDDLSEYGIPAKVISLPGHTDGSIGIDVDNKYLIVGDALMNIVYPTVSMLYHNEKDMLNSARRITQLGERTIYFGHGKPLANNKWVK